ncbi:MAG: DNA cytosine methyltransferase [Ferruginibacter sp.]
MRHIGLFEGIGGFPLAARWMGWKTIAWCELNPFCQKILRRHFPEAEGHGDIKVTDFKKYANRIDILTGGDPCQPHSKAGKRKGKSDDRYLWPEMLRAIREIKPRWVVNENVRNSINTGLLDQKIRDLENEGYACWPPLLIPSGAKGIHERYRFWLVAYSNENADSNQSRKIHGKTRESQEEKQRENGEWVRPEFRSILTEYNWQEIASKFCGDINGISRRLDRNGAIGNAIDPTIVYEIFKAIELTEMKIQQQTK